MYSGTFNPSDLCNAVLELPNGVRVPCTLPTPISMDVEFDGEIYSILSGETSNDDIDMEFAASKALRNKPDVNSLLKLMPNALEALSRIGMFGHYKRGEEGGDATWHIKPPEYFLDKAIRHYNQYCIGMLQNKRLNRNNCHLDHQSGQSHLNHAAWDMLAAIQVTSIKEDENHADTE